MLNIKSMGLGAVAGLALAGLCGSAAFAAPLTITWNPSLTTPPLSTAGAFTFNNGTIQDFAGISLTPTATPGVFSVQEQGFTPLVAFSNGATLTTPAGLNGSLGASPFQLYGAFTATATLTCTSPNNCTGASGSTFSAVNFTLLGNAGNTDVFGFDPLTGNATVNGTTVPPLTDITLATGTLAPGQNTGGISNGVPTAAVTTTFVPNAAEAGFFVSPPATMVLDLFGSFVNNSTEVTCYAASALSCTGVTYGGAVPAAHAAAGETVFYQIGNNGGVINPGGGSINFEVAAVPEPGSLSLLGIALLGFGALLTRRGRKGRVREA